MADTVSDKKLLLRQAGTLLTALPKAMLVELCGRTSLDLLELIMRQQLGQWKLPDIVASLFPDLPRERLEEICAEITINTFKDVTLRRLWTDPRKLDITNLINYSNVDWLRELSAQRKPVILATWHLGPRSMTPLALHKLNLPTLVVAREVPVPHMVKTVSPTVQFAMTSSDPAGAVLVLKQAVERLREGGFVAMAVDGRQGGELVTAPFLGRHLRLGRGMAVLARVTGAPVVPCVLTWAAGTDWRMNFSALDPLPRPNVPPGDAAAFDLAMTRIAVRRFENFTRSNPGQFQTYRLPWMASDPSISQ